MLYIRILLSYSKVKYFSEYNDIYKSKFRCVVYELYVFKLYVGNSRKTFCGVTIPVPLHSAHQNFEYLYNS